MSTYATRDPEFIVAEGASDFDTIEGTSSVAEWKIVRVSRCLAHDLVAIDIETPTRYDRAPLTPKDARALGELLIQEADRASGR